MTDYAGYTEFLFTIMTANLQDQGNTDFVEN